MRKFLTFFIGILFLLNPMLLKAQKCGIIGCIVDSLGVSVSYASVAVFDLRDSSVVNFGLTDDQGGFELKRLPSGIPLRLLVSHVLYHPHLENFLLDSTESRQLDTLRMSEKQNELSEMLVTWEAPPIVVRNDTVEFNADAFIGRPGSAVEELLKRIPGIEVGDDGQVTYNGRRVSKITVDSKQFFSDDPVILMKNIPAKAIQKVQITEEKDERGRVTETGDVSVNLTLKPWAKKSHFGKAYAGYGSDQRYEAGGMWNFLRDTLQVSLLGYGNNLSQTGFSFSELYKMGGFDRSGMNYISMSQNTLNINGASFGGGRGITESGGGGFNINYTVPKKWSLATSYFFGLTRTNFEQDQESEQDFGDTTLSISTLTRSRSNFGNHAINVKLGWIPDTIHMVYWTPRVTINSGNQSNNQLNLNAYSNLEEKTSIGNELNTRDRSINASNGMFWDMALKRWGYQFRAEQRYTEENGLGENHIRTEIITDTAKSGESQYQERETENRGLALTNSVVIRYKVNDSLNFRFNPVFRQSNSMRRVMVYQQDSTSMENVFLPALSTRFNELRTVYEASFSVYKRIKKSNLNARISSNHTVLSLENELLSHALNRSFQFLLAGASFHHRTPALYMDIDYSYTTELPNSSQLLDLVDNTNPNRIQTGNPDLNPQKVHDLSAWARKTNSDGTFGGNFNARARFTRNGIIMTNFFDETGRSVLRPLNLASGENITYAGAGINVFVSRKTSKKWKHTPSLNLSGNIGKSWQYLNFSAYRRHSYTIRPGISYNIMKNDVFDARLGFWPAYSSNQTLGLSNPVLNRWVSLSADVWWAPHEKYWLEAKGVYTRQASGNPGIKGREFTLVNVAFTRLIFKENRGQIRISIFDLLNQNKAISQGAEGSYVSSSVSNAVTRYMMVSFVYNFNSFQKTDRQRRGFSFW